jgi:hypothetical protein
MLQVVNLVQYIQFQKFGQAAKVKQLPVMRLGPEK